MFVYCKLQQKQAKLITETLSKQDIVISTALIPGRPAPVLITEEIANRIELNKKSESRKKLYFSAAASTGLILFGLIIF